MGCGCNKTVKVTQQASVSALRGTDPPAGAARVAVYEVVLDGEVVTRTTSPTAARSEAKRLHASIRVTSREANEAELAAVSADPVRPQAVPV